MKIKVQYRIGILIPILFILNSFNAFLLASNDKYEVKFFVTDDYCLTCNYQLLKLFQNDLKKNNLEYVWNIVNSNPKRFDYLKNKGEFNALDNVFLDTINKNANYYNLDNFPVVLLLKNDEIIYKTDNFVFNFIKEVVDYDKNTSIISLDTIILDVKDMVIVDNYKYVVDGIKQTIFRIKDDLTEELKIKEIIERNHDLKVFGDIKSYKLHILSNKPVVMVKFNTLKEGGVTSYYEMLINLDDLSVLDFKYDNKSYIISDNLLSLCENEIVYTCFHFDYYKTENKDTIKKQPILATISKSNEVKYHGTIGEIEKLIENEFKYLYVLSSYSTNNYLLLFEQSLGISIFTKYNCETNTIENFKQFVFENNELEKMFKDLKLKEPYGQDLTGKSDYYFEGIKSTERGNFAFVFRSKIKNEENIIEYLIFEFSESLHFQRKKTFIVKDDKEEDKIIKTFFISNTENKIIIGIKSQNQLLKIYEPKL